MKIAIMTWFHYDNYGTVLQAAALVKALQNRGHQVDVIRYFPKEQVYSIPTKNLKKALVKRVRSQRQTEQNPPIVSVIAGEAFNAFREQYMTFTDYCSTLTDLESLNNSYDAFICGSDLIWLPRYFDPRYYLDFVKDTDCMIAYAPSLLDDGEADPTVLTRMGDLIRRFKHLSVREETGRKMLDSVFEIHTEEVADPVLMLSVEEWNSMIDEMERREAQQQETTAVLEETVEADYESFEDGTEITEDDEETAADIEGAEFAEAEADTDAEEAAETEADTDAEIVAETEADTDAEKAAETETDTDTEKFAEAEADSYMEEPIESDTDAGVSENSEPETDVELFAGMAAETDGVEADDASETTADIEPDVSAAADAEASDDDFAELIVEVSDSSDVSHAVSDDEEDEYEGDLVICFQGKHLLYWEAAEKLAARLSLRVQIIPIYQNDLDRKGCIQGTVSPLRFAQLIRDASYVCTDSYHATVLALQFGTELCCFERYTDRAELGRNARIRHILDAVGLLNRLYDSEASLETFLAPIDWIPVNYKLEALRIKSDRYLNDSLDAVETHVSEKSQPVPHVLETFSLCVGCGACEAVCEKDAVHLSMNRHGFLQAVVDEERCIRCGRCTEVCPLRERIAGNQIASGRLLSYTDEESAALHGVSAGGLAARLALVLHEQGYAAAGCVLDEAQQAAVHVLVKPDDEAELLEQFKGSKYLQSSMNNFWAELKDYDGPLVLFGTPCQIASARNVLAGREDVFYVDIVCGGVPSALLYRKYQESQNRKGFFRRPLPMDCFDRMVDLAQCNMQACYECRWRDRSAADLRIGDLRTDFAGRRGAERASLGIVLTDAGTQMINQLMISGYWEGLKKENLAAYIGTHQALNPIKPVFYEELTEQLGNEKTSMKRLLRNYVQPFEKRYSRLLHESMFYEVSEDAHESRGAMLPGETAPEPLLQLGDGKNSESK